MKIGVISAMESEHRRLVACLEGAQEVRKGIYTYMCGKLGNNEAILTRCGIGKVNAAVGAAELVRFFAPDCIVSTGVAGGIDASLHPVLLSHALSMDTPEGESRVHGGLICTGDRFITDRTALDDIKAHFPQGLAVDMESAAIAQTCYLYGIPFLSFRIISDTPGVEGHWQQYTDFWGAMAEHSFQVTRAFLATLPEGIQ